MIYEVLNTKTRWNDKSKPATVHINISGVVSFSIAAVKLLKLKPGMRLTFLLPERDRGIIYFREDPADGLELREGNSTQQGKRLHCCGRKHAKRMMEHFCFTAKTKTFDLKADTDNVNGFRCWFILKSRAHQPVKWRKKDTDK